METERTRMDDIVNKGAFRVLELHAQATAVQGIEMLVGSWVYLVSLERRE